MKYHLKSYLTRCAASSMRFIALAIAICAAGSAWATDSLEETGGTVPTTATLAFKGATLSQLTARTLSGTFGGSWAGTASGYAVTFNNFDRTSEASGTITCQAQVAHESYVKGVLLTFTQSGDNVNVQKTGAKYVSGSAVGPSVASGTNGEYDVSKLKLKLTGAIPNACWVGNFPSSQTTNVGGVSINPVNGSSTVSDGIITYGNPNNANGPAFWFDAVGYVAVVFTVDFTGVTLAENQLLVSFGNASYNTLCGAALKSDGNGAFYATGIWQNSAWTSADDSSNTFTLSGEKTFIATYDKGDSANKATRLYVLEDGVAKAIYVGSKGSSNLKGGDVTKFGVCGAYGSSGSFKNMAGLKLKKMAMYLSSSSLPVTASDLPNHLYTAKYSVANGGTINASTINSGVTTFGCAYVSTEAGATINLDAALDGHGILFDGSISGVPATGLTLGSVNDTVTVSNVSYAPVFKGSGTVSFPNKTLPTETSWMTDSSSWTGTVILNNCGYDAGNSAQTYLNIGSYGNENSFIRAPGFIGFTSNDMDCPATLVIEAGETFALTDGNSSTKPYFAKLKGSGTLSLAKGRTANTQYVIGDVSLFTGTVTLASDIYGHSIVLGGTKGWTHNASYNKKIVIAGSATIANGKTWTADSGIVVNGTLAFDGTGSVAGPVTTANGSTLDFSAATSDARISGALTVDPSTTFNFPASVVWPYQIASSISGGSTVLDAANYTVGGVAGTAPLMLFADGTASQITDYSATIGSAGEYTLAGLFGSASAAGDYTINVNESATLNIPSDTTVYMVTFNVAAGKTLTISGSTLTGATGVCINGPGKVATSTVGQLTGGLKTNAAGLGAGVYELLSWTTPQQYTTTRAGYGTWDVNTDGLASGLTAEPVYGAKAVYLRVYDTETQAARKPLVIWPYGDSITEGYNAQHTGANYRILLYQKLRMLGYNVKSTGVYGLDDGYDSVDPSGTDLTDDDKWHSAKASSFVSAGLRGSLIEGKAALIENVDTLSVQAGTPDVVLLHIGVNDLNGWTEDVESVFRAWSNVVDRLVRNLPTSKIVVSTALHGKEPAKATTNARVDRYNTMIKALMDDMPDEWSGHVVLADLCSIVKSQDTGILYSDNVHPDWWGHDQMAEGWLSQVTNLYTNPAAVDFPSQAALPAIPDSSALGAANKSELADYRAGFTKYGDIRIERGQDINNIVYDNVDANAAASNIGRVGYFVEYVRDDNHAHKWVWVDMDAFGDRDIAAVGLPSANHQQVVNHLHVYSNHGAIDNVAADDDTVSGFIEFTPYNIAQGASSVEGAPADSGANANQMDWNDTVASSGQFAAMQVFRIAPPSGRPAQTIFAFNNWRGFTESAYTPAAEFGIGNFAQHFWSGSIQTLDYIYTYRSEKMNANAYTVKKIEIWTKPVYEATVDADSNFSELTFSPSLPQDYSKEVLVINVPASTSVTLAIDSATTVGSLRFVVPSTSSLTIAGADNLTAGAVYVGQTEDSLSLVGSIAEANLALSTHTETIADDGELSVSMTVDGVTFDGIDTATITLVKLDGTSEVLDGEVDGGTANFSWAPTVSGSAAWCAYEFASNLDNSGSDTTALSADGSFSATTSVDGDGKLYTYSHPYRNITYPNDGNWSAMVRCTVPKLAEAIVVTFGTRTGGLIGLAAGATPDSEMYLVQTTNGGGAYDSHYITNAVMPVLNGTTAQHVYVFTVASNQTVKIYCDNSLIETKVFDSPFTIGGGIQIGTIHGGMGSVGLHGCRSDGNAADPAYSALSEADQKAARVDSMRLYKGVLGPNAIAQLSEEFPAVKLFEATISGGEANVWGSLAWTGGDITTINAYSKAIITVEDDATLTLPASITADELVFEVSSGKTLTLVEAGGGTTLNIGHPIEIDTGSVAFDTSSKTLDFAISGTGYVFVDTGKTISVAPGGSLSRISGSGTVTYASYGSLPSALAFGNWTGTVVLPSFEASGLILNNYGKAGSTIALTGITSGWVNPDYTSVAATLRLDGAVNITAMSTRTYTFAEIDGTGNLSFATAGDQPTSVTITKVAEGYSGTISSSLTKPVTITTLVRGSGVSTDSGTKLLGLGSTSDKVTVTSATVGGKWVPQRNKVVEEARGIYIVDGSIFLVY